MLDENAILEQVRLEEKERLESVGRIARRLRDLCEKYPRAADAAPLSILAEGVISVVSSEGAGEKLNVLRIAVGKAMRTFEKPKARSDREKDRDLSIHLALGYLDSAILDAWVHHVEP